MGSKVVLVDGGNVFNPYHVSEFAQRRGVDAEDALEKILVSRAFTCHQMTGLIVWKVPEAARRYESRLAVVLDMAQLYLTGDVPYSEVKSLFKRALSSLSALTKEGNVGVIVTHSRSPDQIFIDQLLLSKADFYFEAESIEPKRDQTLKTFLGN